MKLINNYFVPDDFELKEGEVFGTKIYTDGRIIDTHPGMLISRNAIGRLCDCGKIIASSYHTICEDCKEEANKDRWLKAKQIDKENLHMFVYSQTFDIFFQLDDSDWSELYNAIGDMDKEDLLKLSFRDLQLFNCKDMLPRQIDIADLFEDRGYEDYDFNSDYRSLPKLLPLVEQANEILKSENIGYEVNMKERPSDEVLASYEEDFKACIAEIISED